MKNYYYNLFGIRISKKAKTMWNSQSWNWGNCIYDKRLNKKSLNYKQPMESLWRFQEKWVYDENYQAYIDPAVIFLFFTIEDWFVQRYPLKLHKKF